MATEARASVRSGDRPAKAKYASATGHAVASPPPVNRLVSQPNWAELSTAFGDDGDDMMLALARQIVSGEEDPDSESVEQVFAQARDAEASADEFLVDDDWKVVEAEPETVGVNGNGHHSNGNGHRDGIGPTVELVVGDGHANGHHGEAPKPQQSLFSWAEFMAEEPVKPKGHSRKPQPAAASLFE